MLRHNEQRLVMARFDLADCKWSVIATPIESRRVATPYRSAGGASIT